MQHVQGSVVFLLWLLLSGQPKAPCIPIAFIQNNSVNFGEISMEFNYTHEFRIKNNGNSPLLIKEVLPDQGCTISHVDKSITPGVEGRIVISLEPKCVHEDKILKKIRVSSNDPQQSELTLFVQASSKQQSRNSSTAAFLHQAKVLPNQD